MSSNESRRPFARAAAVLLGALRPVTTLILGPIVRRVKAIHRRTLGNVTVRCCTCRRHVTWDEQWYRDPETDDFYCQRCRPFWSRHSAARGAA